MIYTPCLTETLVLQGHRTPQEIQTLIGKLHNRTYPWLVLVRVTSVEYVTLFSSTETRLVVDYEPYGEVTDGSR